MIYTKGMDQVEKIISLAPGERLFVENGNGDKVTIGFTNNDDIIVSSASDFCDSLQVHPNAGNCICLTTKR